VYTGNKQIICYLRLINSHCMTIMSMTSAWERSIKF